MAQWPLHLGYPIRIFIARLNLVLGCPSSTAKIYSDYAAARNFSRQSELGAVALEEVNNFPKPEPV